MWAVAREGKEGTNCQMGQCKAGQTLIFDTKKDWMGWWLIKTTVIGYCVGMAISLALLLL